MLIELEYSVEVGIVLDLLIEDYFVHNSIARAYKNIKVISYFF